VLQGSGSVVGWHCDSVVDAAAGAGAASAVVAAAWDWAPKAPAQVLLAAGVGWSCWYKHSTGDVIFVLATAVSGCIHDLAERS
jgi:hypothetical protein